MFAKSLFAARMPHRACAGQVVEWLPDVDCRAFGDQANEITMCPGISTLLSAAAENFGRLALEFSCHANLLADMLVLHPISGDHRAATGYDQCWVGNSPHPVKNAYAYIRLGCLTTMIMKTEESS